MGMDEVKPGLSAELDVEVTAAMTVNRTGREGANVLSTPSLLDLMERCSIEAADPQGVLRYVAVDFAEEGGLTYPDVQSTVLHFLFRDEQVGARLEELSIQPPAKEGAPHRLRARLAFARGHKLREPQRPLPAGVVRYEFDLLFTESEFGWQARGGRYRRL